jgi:hypothetical protein
MEDEIVQNGSCLNGRTEGYDVACKSAVVVYHYVQQELRDWGKTRLRGLRPAAVSYIYILEGFQNTSEVTRTIINSFDRL